MAEVGEHGKFLPLVYRRAYFGENRCYGGAARRAYLGIAECPGCHRCLFFRYFYFEAFHIGGGAAHIALVCVLLPELFLLQALRL